MSPLRIESIKYMRKKGLGIRKIASELSVGVGTVYKVLEAHSVYLLTFYSNINKIG